MMLLECDKLKMTTNKWSCDYTASFRPSGWHVLCGSSGAGKSTLLHLLTGVVTPQSGDIKMGGKNVSHLPPHQRQLSFMSQSNSLFPGISILENLLLALHDSPSSPTEKVKQAREMAERLSLKQEILDRPASKLSGGQLSRCNLARTLLRPCSWLLLDEPFSAVDRPTRLSILTWLQDWQKSTGAGIILVSHDLDDIFTVATDVHIVENGSVLESGTLSDSLAHPRSIAMARTLRAGIIVTTPSGPAFVGSQNLYTSLSLAPVNRANLQSIALRDAQITRLGSTMRIIDLHHGYDVVMPWDEHFEGTLWYAPITATGLLRSNGETIVEYAK